MTNELRGAAAIVGAVDAVSPTGVLGRTDAQLEVEVIRGALESSAGSHRSGEPGSHLAAGAELPADEVRPRTPPALSRRDICAGAPGKGTSGPHRRAGGFVPRKTLRVLCSASPVDPSWATTDPGGPL